MPKLKVISEDVKRIIEMYQVELIPMEKIAEQYNISRMGIYKILKKAGIETRKGIATQLNVSCDNCHNIIKVVRCKVRKLKHHFCSMECRDAWLNRKDKENNPFIENRTGGRHGRIEVQKYFELKEGYVVHHEDRNQNNNDIKNLRVFATNGDHTRYHRGYEVPILFNGNDLHNKIPLDKV
jgi:hypothetical protein